jgi:hypothetical protein
MDLSLTIPDDLAARLRSVEDRLPEILELGLKEWLSTQPGYSGLNGLLETLARLPTPDEVLALRPTPAVQNRIEELLDKKRNTSLSRDEMREWEQFEYIEHLVRLAKARALERRAQQ